MMPAAKTKTALKDSTLQKFLRSPPAAGQRLVIWDALMPNHAIRVTDRGTVSFYCVKRRAGDTSPTWHRLGVYPAMGLGAARDAARDALLALERGEHPGRAAKARASATRQAEAEAARNTFAAVAQRYLLHLTGSDSGPRASSLRTYRMYLDRHLIPGLGDKPVAAITRKEVIDVLDGVKERAGVASTLGAKSLLSAILSWAADRELIAINPAAGLKAKSLVGRTQARDRALNDAELVAVWNALPAAREPFASLYRLLILTGCRLAEIAGSRWSEFDGATLTIPAERSKNGLPMLVPLPPRAIEILEAMPRFTGEYIFTSSGGRRPITAYSLGKARLDAALAKTGAKVEPFVIHDFRRTFRSGLASLGVPQEVAEACLNHKPPGIIGTYNRHSYLDEKAEALRKWEGHVLSLLEPTPGPDAAGKVVRLRRA